MKKKQGRRRRQLIRTFTTYENVVRRTDEKRQRLVSLVGLVGEIGDLHTTIKKRFLSATGQSLRTEMREELGDVLWYLASLAVLEKIPLQEIAQSNADKAMALYSEGKLPTFDKGYGGDERFPRRFLATFIEKPLNRGIYVRISLNNVTIGDALTDNAHTDDGYRYHDVFHLAYAAVLGWSPVTRGLLKCKRKSAAKIDEVEDGARAAIIEEAVSILVFNQAKEREWYQNSASIDIGLLKTIRRMTNGLEVRSCTAKQWKSAIHQGYLAFKQLRVNRGGRVQVDLDAQRIEYLLPGQRGKRAGRGTR